MKKWIKRIPLLICILYAIFPVMEIVTFAVNLSFEPYNTTVSLILITAISLILSIMFTKNINEIPNSKSTKVFLKLSLPLSFVSGIYFIDDGGENKLFFLRIILILITIIISIVLYKRYSAKLILQVVIITISVLMSLFLIFCIFLLILFGNFSSNTVIKSLNSPENTYTAEIIDNNQGALGGATLVRIQYNNQKFTVLIGEFKKTPEIIYDGNWGEFENMTIEWKNEDILLINNAQYSID